MSIESQISKLKEEGIYLWEETGKLKYRAKEGAMKPEIIVWLKENKEDILISLQGHKVLAHNERNRYEPFPLTPMQNAYLVGRGAEYELGGTGCHSYTEFRIPQVDCDKLEKAWHQLIMYHDMLRAVYTQDGMQRVVEKPLLPTLEVNDLRSCAKIETETKLAAIRKRWETKDYNIGDWPMHAFGVTMLSDACVLHFSVDMLIADFVSVNVMVSELFKFYADSNIAPATSELTYRDIVMEDIVSLEEERKNKKYEEAKAYWQYNVSGMGGTPLLPILKIPRKTASFHRHVFQVKRENWGKIKTYAREYGITSSSAVMTAYIELISRWSTNQNFCINLTLMDRKRDYMTENQIVGDFTTVDVFRVDADRMSFIDRAKKYQARLMEDLNHKDFSGMEVLKELSRQQKQKIVIPIVFTSTLGALESEMLPRDIEMVYGVSRTPQVWIDCQIIENQGTLIVNWDVRDGVFEDGIIDEMFYVFEMALEHLVHDRDCWLKESIITLPETTCSVRAKVNNTACVIPKQHLYDGFLHQLETNSQAIALVTDGTKYSYQELARYVQAVGKQLQELQIQPNDKIAIVEGKSVWQIASVLAVLITGGVYVPIAVDQPLARKQQIIADSDTVCVIGRADLQTEATAFIDLTQLQLEEEFCLKPAEIGTDQQAYIIFTSGSTGRPKGVVIRHEAAMNTILDINQRFGIGEKDVILGVSALTFDLSVYDIFGAFAAGGTLVLPTQGLEKSPAHWKELIDQYQVSLWNSVPALLSLLMDYHQISGFSKILSMKCILLSGDLIPRTFPEQIKTVFDDCQVYSLGGATEGSIWSIYYPITDYNENTNIPYGLPLSNQQFYVLDDMDRVCPNGVIGELCIGGVGVAEGYYKDEKLTSEKFYVHPEIGSRIYRTGDLGRYRRDGVLEFAGRKDFQVKLNGHRIELGEIEHALLQHPDVERAVATVFTDTDGHKLLEAFVVPTQSEDCTDYSKQANKLQQKIIWSAEQSLDGRSKEDVLAWKRCSEQTAVADMFWVFRSVGLFTEATHSLDEIMFAIHPDSGYERIVKRWLNVLVEEGILRFTDNRYQATENAKILPDHKEAWDVFEQLEERVHYSRDLFDYQKMSGDLLLSQIRGDVRGLDLFFPQGNTDVAEAAYNGNVVNRILNEAVKTSMTEVVAEKYQRLHRTIEILEIGAGVGGTTKAVIPALKEFDVRYHFTDVSKFFLNKAKETYGAYDFMSYGIYDINQPFEEQGLEAGAFDIILCANVLHNSKNCPEVLEQIKCLLSVQGVLIMIDTTEDSYSLLTSLELKGGLNDFEDIRKEREQTFFDEADWNSMFEVAAYYPMVTYPQAEDAFDEIGQKMFVCVVNDTNKEIQEESMKAFLREHLLPYMIPSRIKVLKELPLSANGKVDRKKLKPIQVLDDKQKKVVDELLGGMEQKVAAIWRDILQIEDVGRDDNFYSVGGDSLLIAQVVTKMKEGVEELSSVSWDELMRETLKNPTIRGICALIDNEQTQEAGDMYHDSRCMYVYQEGNQDVVTAFFHAGTGRIRDYSDIAPALCKQDSNRTVVGFTYGDESLYTMMPAEQLIEVRAQVYANRLMELKANHYRLVGYCVGGFLAMETAKVLIERGCNVEPVLTISSHLCLHRIENQMLLECAYGVILGADVYKAGYRGNPSIIRSALESILNGVNRNVSNEELCRLSGPYEELGTAFQNLSQYSHKERMQRIYDSIKNPDFNGTESTVSMLNILYNIFEHTYKAMIHYKPDFFSGDMITLIPDEELLTTFPVMASDTDWEEFVLGNVEKHVIHGNHNTCIKTDRMDQIMKFLV